jgi:hypothetical protein
MKAPEHTAPAPDLAAVRRELEQNRKAAARLFNDIANRLSNLCTMLDIPIDEEMASPARDIAAQIGAIADLAGEAFGEACTIKESFESWILDSSVKGALDTARGAGARAAA